MGDVLSFENDEARIDMWAVHDHPDRPLDRFALICSCDACRVALLEEARLRPRSVLCLKTRCDRIVVTAEYLAEVLVADRDLGPLLYVADDYVRQIFVPIDGWLPASARWWSLTCHEDEERAQRRHAHHRKAKRQTKRARRAAAAAAGAADDAVASSRPLVPFHEAVASARSRHRRVLVDAAAWALGRGEPLDLDIAALICVAAGDPLRWSRTGVHQFLYSDSCNWCSLAATLMPDQVPETLWRWIDFLADRGLLASDSDPVTELRKPLLCYGGLDEHGRLRPSNVPRPIPCQCYVTYDGPKHGDGAI